MMNTRHEFAFGEVGYPDALCDLEDRPGKLYVMGDPEALHGKALAVVGARRCTPYGEACAAEFAKQAVEMGYAIVSGGALGIDAAAHRAALKAGGRTVAVLACGADRAYPKLHRELFDDILRNGGCIVSEMPWGSDPMIYEFPRRNRIIAGLSNAMLAVECGLPSGTFTACERMMDLDRPLLAVPGSIFAEASRGTNHLIAERLAHPVVDPATFGRWLE